MRHARILAATVFFVAIGLAPGMLYALLPNPVEYHPYTASHVVGSLQLLTGTALGFWLLRRALGGEPTVTMDVDRLYRRTVPMALAAAGRILLTAGEGARRASASLAGAAERATNRREARLPGTIATQAGVLAVALAAALLLLLHVRGQ